MELASQVFSALPDIIIFTDAYWYILDYNREGVFEKLKRGKKLTHFMPDCTTLKSGVWQLEDKTFLRTVTPLYEKDSCVGYTIYLVDLTEKIDLIRQTRKKSAELNRTMQTLKKRNKELEEMTRLAETLSDYSELLRIARTIHDGIGHTITSIHTISQMCLECREKDPVQYRNLLDTGISLCESLAQKESDFKPSSLEELLKQFQAQKPFPVLLDIHGKEPSFAADLYEIIYQVCKEAYYNTLSHSFADSLQISVSLEPQLISIHISDNGCFRGDFNKGFGLKTMEKIVKQSGGTITFIAAHGKGFGIEASWRVRHGTKNQSTVSG